MPVIDYEKEKREKFSLMLSQLFGVSLDLVEQMLRLERKSSFRVNTNKCENPEELLKKLSAGATFTPVDWCKNAYFIDSGREFITNSPEFKSGLLYVQNASSLLPPLLLNPVPEDHILDMCAAPGGKALHICELAGNKLHMYVNDKSWQRVLTLKELIELYGANVEGYFQQPAQFLDRYTNVQFDKILLDAQCSGEGMIDFNNSRAMKYWNPSKSKKFGFLQKKMLRTAYRMLKPGGTIVYSTCTFTPEENEEVIDFALKNCSDLKTVDIAIDLQNSVQGVTSWKNKKYNPAVQKALRVVPSSFMEGFFVCVLKKA